MSPELKDFVALRRAALAATPGFAGGDAAAGRLAALHHRGRALGMVHERVVRDGRAIAQLVCFRDPEPWLGTPMVLGWVDREPRDVAALGPLLDAFDRHRARFDDTSLIELRPDDGPLLRELIARGFGIDSVIQLGEPAAALAALERAGAEPVDETLRAHGLRLEPLDRARVTDVVDLHRAVFSDEPDWCWFGAFPKHLARIRTDLEADRAGHYALVDVSARAAPVVGHLGAELADNPYFGRTGGLELVLAGHLRGRGLARPLYRAALSSLVERGAERIKGGTSQPGVLALGRVMRRPWHALNLRRDVPFGPEHFLRFAPDAVREAHAR